MMFLRWRIAVLLAFLLAPALAAPAAQQPPVTPALPSAFDDVDDVPLPDPDLWQRIRMGFRLEPLDSPNR